MTETNMLLAMTGLEPIGDMAPPFETQNTSVCDWHAGVITFGFPPMPLQTRLVRCGHAVVWMFENEAGTFRQIRPETVSLSLQTSYVAPSKLERTIAALTQFAATPACGISNAANEALNFLNMMPQYLPAPKAVESDSGVIALFWDDPNFYADIEFRGDGNISIFTRNRRTGNDDGDDNYALIDVTSEWLRKYLSPLFPLLVKTV